MLRSAGILAALLAGASAAFASSTGPELVFVHVEANVGGASGGHAALRVEDEVFHVQQIPDGLFRLVRQPWGQFRHVYAGLQNRGLHVARVAVSEVDRERVLRGLARAHVVQQAALARRDRLEGDLAWLEAWASGEAAPPLRGAGLLDPAQGGDPHAARLRERVATQYGVAFLRDRIEQLSRRIAAFEPGGELESLREALGTREALLALDEARGLAPGALLPRSDEISLALSDHELASLERFAAAQERAVLELLGSGRPDLAHPLQLAIARWLALQRSLESGRLELLDAFPEGVQPLAETERASSEGIAKLAADAAAVLAKGRATLLAGDRLDEPAYNLLELAAALAAELGGAARGGPLRELPPRASPERSRSLGPLAAPADRAGLGREIARARRALARERDALRERWGYDLLRRNCITELVRLVNGSFEDRADVERALGGYLEPGDRFGFVPFVFFAQVRERLRVVGVEHVASHRQRALARVLAVDSRAGRRLTEATALASSIYTPRLRDGAFLLFSEGPAWARPLLGVLNLGWALGAIGPGIVAAPFDRAARLRAAGSGVFFSLPELAFVNLRKGTFEYVEARAEPAP